MQKLSKLSQGRGVINCYTNTFLKFHVWWGRDGIKYPGFRLVSIKRQYMCWLVEMEEHNYVWYCSVRWIAHFRWMHNVLFTILNGKGLQYAHIKEHKAHQKNDNILIPFVNCYHVALFWNCKKTPRQVTQCCSSHLFIWSLLNAACYWATYGFGMSKLVKSMNPFIVGLKCVLPVLVVYNGARDMEILPFPHKFGPVSVSLQDYATHTYFLFSELQRLFLLKTTVRE